VAAAFPAEASAAAVAAASSVPTILSAVGDISGMKKKKTKKHMRHDELRPEYDFSKLGPFVRGKYYEHFKNGTNLMLLALDVVELSR
jgi:hypothetical protein